MNLMLAAIRLQYSQALPWVFPMLLVFGAVTLVTYPAQLRKLPAVLRWLLPSVRMLAVSALVLSLLRPVITRPRLPNERAPVVVLLDDSLSMSVVNANRPDAEWVSIAAALGKLPAEAGDKPIDTLQTHSDRLAALAEEVLRARSELDYARLSGRGVESARGRMDQTIEQLQDIAREANTNAITFARSTALVKVLSYLVKVPADVDREAWLDHLREKSRQAASFAEQLRMSSDAELYESDPLVADACESLKTLSRFELAKLATGDPQQGLVARLRGDTSVIGYCIADEVRPIDLTDSHAMDSMLAQGSITNLTGGIRAVLDSLKGAPPRAVVLFSDGRLIHSDGDSATLSAIAGIPVYTVNIAAKTGLKDLAIVNATVQSNAIVGETITLNAELRQTGLRGTSAVLTLSGEGIFQSRTITFNEDRPLQVWFPCKLSKSGELQLTLDLSAAPGELSTENNKVVRWVHVSSATTRPATTRPATRPIAEAELVDLSGDEGWLRRIADTSGGHFYRLDQVDLLPKDLAAIRDDDGHPIEISLWDSGYLFALVLGCLTTEWGLRKKYGLV